ncbi:MULTISPECIES: hypothetical protein [Thermomonosporaceae]|uniref:hypothetical protein n=1 Tax=Thermomonosporaceae TaxID=2012 RepID=UPI00255A7A75|nr:MULTISPECIES: hypothetical protein [Thermomonosporaceae]MDL4777807.1 hypothetical protein [Actinomadura xylanilytica]
MGGFPYALPGTMPPRGDLNWDVPLNANLADLKSRVLIDEAAYGAPLDAFSGATDDAKLTAAMKYAAAQTRPPAIVLANRAHSFSGPRAYYNGFRMVGSLGTGEREFAGTGPQCVVTASSSAKVPALFAVPSGGVKNMWVSGIQFRAASGRVNFQQPATDFAAGPIMSDATFLDLAWVGFATVQHARHLRVRIDRTYTNGGGDTQFKLAGSDNYYWQNGGYLSSTRLAATKFYCWFTHMSRSQFGPLYITPEKATGIRIDGSHGGFVFTGTLLDSTGRTGTTACQGAALLVTGGKGHVFDKLWFFNNCVNPATTGRSPRDRGQAFLRGSASEVLFSGCQFAGFGDQPGQTPSGTPAIYAATGVRGVKVVAPMAPAGGTRLLQQQSAGIIGKYAADDWSLAVA